MLAASKNAVIKARRRVLRACRGARQTLRHQGLLALLWQTFARCISPFGSVELWGLYEKDLSQGVPEIKAKVEIAVTQASESDMGLIAAEVVRDYHLGRDQLATILAKMRLRFRLGQACFIAKVGSTVVHFAWVALRWSPSVADHFVVLKDDEAYYAWGYTIEAWRGRGIHATVNSQMLRVLRKRGYRRAYAVVKTDNRSSRKGLKRVGWEEFGRLLTFRPRREDRIRLWCISGTPGAFLGEQPSEWTSIFNEANRTLAPKIPPVT